MTTLRAALNAALYEGATTADEIIATESMQLWIGLALPGDAIEQARLAEVGKIYEEKGAMPDLDLPTAKIQK